MPELGTERPCDTDHDGCDEDQAGQRDEEDDGSLAGVGRRLLVLLELVLG